MALLGSLSVSTTSSTDLAIPGQNEASSMIAPLTMPSPKARKTWRVTIASVIAKRGGMRDQTVSSNTWPSGSLLESRGLQEVERSQGRRFGKVYQVYFQLQSLLQTR